MPNKFDMLSRMAGKPIGREMRQELDTPKDSMFSTLVDYLGRPNAAIKSGISAYQQDQDILDALQKGFMSPSDEAPTGFDIASRFGEQTNIESPAALTAIATLAEMADIPGLGLVGKGGKLAKGMNLIDKVPSSAIKNIPGFGKASKTAGEAYDLVAKTPKKPLGRVVRTPDRIQPSQRFQSLRDRIGDDEVFNKIIKERPELKGAKVDLFSD